MTQPSEGSSKDDPIAENIELRWPDDIGNNTEVINQVLFSWDQQIPDAMYMYLGHVAPPPWLTEELAREKLKDTKILPIIAKGSFLMSRTRAEEFWDALGRHLGKLPKQ